MRDTSTIAQVGGSIASLAAIATEGWTEMIVTEIIQEDLDDNRLNQHGGDARQKR